VTPPSYARYLHARTHLYEQRYGQALRELEGVERGMEKARALIGEGRLDEAGQVLDGAPPDLQANGDVSSVRALLLALRGDRAEVTVGKVPESNEDLYQVRIGRTVIRWEGHRAGASAWAAPAVEENWYTDSARNSRITGLASFRPDSAQSIAGTLGIVGKDDLAKSLRASPIRMVGPMMWGGGGKIDFSK